eukprot:TRINITY_DN1866_c0_g1_i1.p1 TRINITY_DN1866_c0_g1~~TRINITY_DN1866_c0_g1_i1.p1  ORF type:complete len:370 (+),score=64.40 TRINITY_DN1866_c0_g1_i1:825-1934(+)
MIPLIIAVLLCVVPAGGHKVKAAEEFFAENGRSTAGHTNNWAVLVDTSRFWANYRHAANVLSMYHMVKGLGIPDSNIILMMGDDVSCNIRNPLPATLYNNQNHNKNLFGTNIEVDYRGYDVTVESFLRLLTGRHHPDTPHNKKLLSDENSNVLIFLTGHGGDKFLKFQDAAEVSSQDIEDSLWQMWLSKRYRSTLLIVETCQAGTLIESLTAPSVVAIGSSLGGENSYSHHNDREIGLHVVDRFTYYTLEKLTERNSSSQLSLHSFFNHFDPALLHSHPFWVSTHVESLKRLRVMDFFASRTTLEILNQDDDNNIPEPDVMDKKQQRNAVRKPHQQPTRFTVDSIRKSLPPAIVTTLVLFVVFVISIKS